MNRLAAADLRLRLRSLLGLAAGTFAFSLFLAGTYTSFGGAEMLNSFFGQSDQPSFFAAFSGSRSVGIFGPREYLAFGLNHPLFLLLAFSVGISIGVNSVAGDIENHRAELLYTRPITRTRILDTRVMLWVAAQAFVLAVGVAGFAIGISMSPDLSSYGVGAITGPVVQFVPLALVVGATAFLASALARTKGRAMGITIAVVAGSYLVKFVSLLWEPAEPLGYFTPFGYYNPIEAVHGVDWVDFAVLSVLAAGLLIGARHSVRTRDL